MANLCHPPKKKTEPVSGQSAVYRSCWLVGMGNACHEARLFKGKDKFINFFSLYESLSNMPFVNLPIPATRTISPHVVCHV